MKQFLLGLITVSISLAATLFVAELIVRIVWTPPSTLSTQVTEQHPIYGWAPRPGIVGRKVSMEFDHRFSITTQGLRGSDLFTAARPSNIQRRILFLGDSFTYGNGSENDEIFVELINSSLPHAEIINTGANGYGQRQQLAILDTLGATLKPDLVVLMFFWNDVEDNARLPVPSFAISDAGRVTRTDLEVPLTFHPLAHRTAKPPKDLDERLLRRVYLYKVFKEGARGFRHRFFGSKAREIQSPEQLEMAWKLTDELLRLIHLRSVEIGSKFVVVSIPDYQLVDTKQGFLKGQKSLTIEIEDQLRRACRKIGVPYLDLLPELKRRQVASANPLYYSTDRHFTPEGNAAVAEIMAPMLAKLLGRPDSSSVLR